MGIVASFVFRHRLVSATNRRGHVSVAKRDDRERLIRIAAIAFVFSTIVLCLALPSAWMAQPGLLGVILSLLAAAAGVSMLVAGEIAKIALSRNGHLPQDDDRVAGG